jgi:predicted MFS family arabinose efflux permease
MFQTHFRDISAAGAAAPVPLRRNRDFLLLSTGQGLSGAGSQATTVAYPLLVLALTHSPARAGVVSFARLLPVALVSLPAGVLADRVDRRRLMVAADVARLAVLAALALAVAAGEASFWAIVAAAAVEGAGTAVFAAAQPGALRAVVPAAQLPAAISVRTGRSAVAQLGGPPLGGALFAVSRALPFAVDAASYAVSTVSLLAMRTPFQGPAGERTAGGVRAELAEGASFVWRHPFLRTTTLLFGIANFLGPGLVLIIVVVGRRQGLSGGEVGALVAIFGGSLLAGSLVSPLVRRALPVRAILVLELCTWPLCAAFLLWPSVYVLTAAVVPTALAVPSTDSVVHAYRIALTPDLLLGRAEAVRLAVSLLVAPLGPLAAGLLLAATSERAAVAVFAAVAVALAVWGVTDPAIRAAPALDELRTA